jgi:uncharacterized membrane protein
VAALIALVVVVGGVGTIPGFPIVHFHGVVRVLVWGCIGVFFGVTLFATVVKGVSVMDMRRGVTSATAQHLRSRGHRKLDELHAGAQAATTDA